VGAILTSEPKLTEAERASVMDALWRDFDPREDDPIFPAVEAILRDRLAPVEAERDRLRHLLGSHADGHRCTCEMTDPGRPGISPPEWEQDPWCPTHPNMDYVLAEVAARDEVIARVRALAEQWEQPGPKVGGTPEDAAWALRVALAVPAPQPDECSECETTGRNCIEHRTPTPPTTDVEEAQ
jgi:hypothetical protein